jgi:AGZA family xanthine/uracil permease-like MFS transporter
MAAAAITGFIAKENVVGTLAVCFVGLDNLVDTEELTLIEGAGAEVAGIMAISKAAALAYLMFNLYSPPCFAAIGAMNAEMKSKKWLFAGIGLQLGVGYTLGFTVFFFGSLFAGESFGQDLLNVLLLVISFSLVNMFDSIGTLLGAAKQSNLVDEDGNIVRMKEALMSDAISTAAGALCGTSTVTTVVEGSAGIAAGGRTGMTSLTTAIMFLVAIVFAPVVGMIPSVATAPALIYVGVLMLSNIKDVDFEDITNAIPAFCAIVFMPFTYSIANGVAIGLILHCVMKALTGKFKEIKPLTLIVALIFVFRYAFVSM